MINPLLILYVARKQNILEVAAFWKNVFMLLLHGILQIGF